MEVSVRPPKQNYDVIMTSFLITKFQNWHILQIMIQAINPLSFNALECLDQILWKGVEAPTVLQRDKKPSGV